MRMRSRLLLLAALCVVGLASPTIADDTYRYLRLFDNGPYRIVIGTSSANPDEKVIMVEGATKSIHITYPAEVSPQLSYGSGYVQLELPNVSLRRQAPVPEWNKRAVCNGDSSSLECWCDAYLAHWCWWGDYQHVAPADAYWDY